MFKFSSKKIKSYFSLSVHIMSYNYRHDRGKKIKILKLAHNAVPFANSTNSITIPKVKNIRYNNHQYIMMKKIVKKNMILACQVR